MHKPTRFVSLGLIFLAACLILAGLSLTPQEASYAATSCKPPASPTVTITGVSPTTVNNTVVTNITVTGSGFITTGGVVVSLEGFGPLSNVVVNGAGTSLTADVPIGVPGTPSGRLYNLDVFNPTTTPNKDCAVLKNALTVFGLAPTAGPQTAKPSSTPEPTLFERPQTQVVGYSPSPKSVYPGENLDFTITLQSVGETTARNVTATFVTGDLVPRETGGVHFAGDMDPGATTTFAQPLRVSSQISKGEAVMKLQVVYNDDYGKQYTDNFDVAVFPIYYQAAATATPTPVVHPQIALTAYQTTPAQLGPGTTFKLDMDLTNLSGELARQLVLEINASASTGNGSSNATSTAGNASLSASGNDLVIPLNSSSTRYIDQLASGQSAHITFNMAISGTATGQYVPINLGMTYFDSTSAQHAQTETISLRIDTVPFLFVHFLTAPPSRITVGDSLDLPVEIINIGTNRINVSNIDVTSDQMTVTNGTLYVGPLDAGTSGSVPSQLRAEQPGLATVTVSIHYLDDFQQAQVATYDLPLQVEAAPTPTPEAAGQGGGAGGGAGAANLTIFDRLLRAILGFFGFSTRSVGGGFGGGNAGRGGAAAATPTP